MEGVHSLPRAGSPPSAHLRAGDPPSEVPLAGCSRRAVVTALSGRPRCPERTASSPAVVWLGERQRAYIFRYTFDVWPPSDAYTLPHGRDSLFLLRDCLQQDPAHRELQVAAER